MHAPWESHFAFMRRIITFLSGTINHGLHIGRLKTSSLTAYSDVDLGGGFQIHVARSTFAYYVFG